MFRTMDIASLMELLRESIKFGCARCMVTLAVTLEYIVSESI